MERACLEGQGDLLSKFSGSLCLAVSANILFPITSE